MLKKLPSEVIENIHYCLTRVWDERGTLDWLLDRWLVAIPKKEHDVVKLGDLRPLILVDTFGKLWCKILLQRILEVWKRNDVLRAPATQILRGTQHHDRLPYVYKHAGRSD